MTAAWPKNAAELAAPHVLSEFGACIHCGHPVHTTGIDIVVHTATGLYSCGQWPGGTAEMDTVASQDERDNALNKACEQAVENATDSIKDDVGYDLRRWLDTLERKYTGDDGNMPGLKVREWSNDL